MKKIPKQEYTAEFRELAVKRVKEGLTPSAAAKELGVNHQTLRNRIKAVEAGKLNGAGTKQPSTGSGRTGLILHRAESIASRYFLRSGSSNNDNPLESNSCINANN